MSENTSWIEKLEAKVDAAVAEIERLRAENAALRKTVTSPPGQTDREEDEGRSAWAEERDRVKARVEGIVERLEGLLGD